MRSTPHERIADGLGLLAGPTFAIIGVGTALYGGPPVCSTLPHWMPIDGMASMYLLMSVFHAGPWLRRGAWFRRRAAGP